MDPSLLLIPAIAIGSCIFVLWLISVQIKDASIADIWWGPGFAVVAWTSGLGLEHFSGRHVLAAFLFSLWGIRLGIYLGRRNIGHGEDRRYQAMRGGSPHFWWVSFFQVFLLQGGLQLLVAMPIYAIASSGLPLGPLDALGAAVVLAGIATEATADNQLRAFKKEASNKGKVMREGIWGWSRHPNYFGNALMWMGFGLLGMAADAPLWIWMGPGVMWFLLLRVSGVAMLERTIVDRRPSYRDYIEEVSAFIPMPPKRLTQQRGSA
jgi:steroid 5-alpha reductase family enzyme